MRFFFIISFFTLVSAGNQHFLSEKIIYGVKKLFETERKTLKLANYVSELNKIVDADEKNRELCKTCNGTIQEIIRLRRTGLTKDEFQRHMYNLCQVFTTWDPAACDGYINIETDVVLFMIDHNPELNGERFCSIYFQVNGCKDPKRDDWDVEIPPKDKTLLKKPCGTSDGSEKELLHLTDFHYDPLYMPSSNAKCQFMLCCQSSSGLPKNPAESAGYWGDYRVCDMPWHSVLNALHHIKNTHKNLEYVYYTGDIISHRSWDTTIQSNTASLKVMYGQFKDIFGDVKVFPILGNHEAHPTNFFVEKNVTKISTQWLFDLVAKEWSRWLPKDALETVKQGGFYTLLLKPGLRLIALNSNVCYVSNLWLFYADKDPYGQLQWFADKLKEAEDAHESVHVLSHVPPGNVECLRNWNEVYLKIVSRFAGTIVAQFNGHTHYDEFRLQYNKKKSRVINVAWNGGSFTTFVGMNPNYRVYKINNENHQVNDYDQWTYNMSLANNSPLDGPQWYKLYSFKNEYGVRSLSLDDLSKLVDNMKKDKKILQNYYRNQVRDSDVMMARGCDENCLQRKLCAIKSTHTDDAIACNDS